MSASRPLLRIERMHGNAIAPRGVADGATGTTRNAASVGVLYVIGQGQYEQLQRMVFAQEGPCPVFAVLDGAIVDDLPSLLQRHAPDAMCLFSGDLDPMLAAAAPYLLALAPGNGGAQLALRDGWNAHWGIVLVADPGTEPHALRAHLRRILRVGTPGGDSMLFRFYDPRAFRSVVPSFDAGQRKAFFGPIRGCYVESRDGQGALYFARDGEATPRVLPLAAAA